jgi:hypothetical protein
MAALYAWGAVVFAALLWACLVRERFALVPGMALGCLGFVALYAIRSGFEARASADASQEPKTSAPEASGRTSSSEQSEHHQ